MEKLIEELQLAIAAAHKLKYSDIFLEVKHAEALLGLLINVQCEDIELPPILCPRQQMLAELESRTMLVTTLAPEEVTRRVTPNVRRSP